jgi:hypothetical protein
MQMRQMQPFRRRIPRTTPTRSGLPRKNQEGSQDCDQEFHPI